ncbi:MAG TPA: S8 family serine peptidase, partial [Rudaea sp.]|nr:S8 family serine peptidase [Rudaea sp.]
MRLRFALLIALFPLVVAAAPAADNRHTWLVRLQGPSLVEHVHARVAAQNLAVVEGGEKPAMRRELRSSLAQDYLQQLDAGRTRVLDAGSAELGRMLMPRTVYRYAGNGMALSLTDAEAVHLATLPGVLGVRRERILHPLTDAGPQWIGADKLWNGQVAGVATTKGEGVVIGIIDTGISPTHPSFAATGPDGYAIANPRGHFYGLCASAQATCNNKLIGIYDFTDEGTKGIDSVGHGTHVAGIAAGDGMDNALKGMTVSLSRFVSGVAPHANIIMYKACKSGTAGGTCPESDLVGALDQAIADNVDVINYSIGGDAQDAWQLLAQGNTDAAVMLNARTAGIVVVAAAGNEGPGPNSLGEPGNAPWVIGVANATHNRQFANSIGGFSGAANAPPTLTGAGYTAGYGSHEIVYAGNYGNALCGTGPTDYPPTGKSNPFPPGTFNGQIVICDRGIYARVEKGYNVKLGGAGGYILANAQSDGESIVSDDHYLPAVHLGYSEGAALKAWVASSGSHQGAISGVSALLQASLGDILNSSSSRGPYGGYGKISAGGILKPDITAPGTNILSSDYQSNGLVFMSG